MSLSPALLAVAICLALVIEGFLYALFPKHMRKMLIVMVSLPEETLRQAGLFCAALGVGLLFVALRFFAM